jgi:hypothetical protein
MSSSSTSTSANASQTDEKTQVLQQLNLIQQETGEQEFEELSSTPIIPASVLSRAQTLFGDEFDEIFCQYGLLAGNRTIMRASVSETSTLPFTIPVHHDPRIFFNTAAPSSTFICGSQGSGKSHTSS